VTLPDGTVLWLAEQEMRSAAKAGTLVDKSEGSPDPSQGQGWGRERTVRATVLRHLLVEKEWPVASWGVRLRGVRISGFLDLKAATLRCPLCLDGCYFDAGERICLEDARGSLIELTDCELPGISAGMLRVRTLKLSRSRLRGPLLLGAAHIAGQLVCRGTRLIARDAAGNALVADELRVGSVFLDQEFEAAGAIRLHSADISGQLLCSGAQLKGHDGDDDSLVADRIKVGGDLFLDDRFSTAGGVRLLGADIAGQLNCQRASLNAEGHRHEALLAKGIRVGGDLGLDSGFCARGTVVLRSARVRGSLNVAPGRPGSGQTSFDITNADVTGTLNWFPDEPVEGEVSLEGTSVHRLDDDWGGGREHGFWPADGRLKLNGFTYGGFGGERQATADERLAWIRSQYDRSADGTYAGFSTQPYEQLIAVYRQGGQETEARKVAIARRADLRRYGHLNWYRLAANWLLDKTIKYGYQSWRAGAGLAALFIIVWVLSVVAQHLHIIVPVGNVTGLKMTPSADRCMADYPCFFPAGYAIDTVIPIINVHQAQYWGPGGHGPWGWAWVTGTWIATALGWALATLLVAGYTGLVRQD
jgi:hypothetical protein